VMIIILAQLTLAINHLENVFILKSMLTITTLAQLTIAIPTLELFATI
jgi:hypothetical protein